MKVALCVDWPVLHCFFFLFFFLSFHERKLVGVGAHTWPCCSPRHEKFPRARWNCENRKNLIGKLRKQTIYNNAKLCKLRYCLIMRCLGNLYFSTLNTFLELTLVTFSRVFFSRGIMTCLGGVCISGKKIDWNWRVIVVFFFLQGLFIFKYALLTSKQQMTDC